MDFTLPEDLSQYLAELDEFIEAEIRPLEEQDDNIRFFDHRREHARTDWDNQGLPRKDWEALLAEARRRAEAAEHERLKAMLGVDGDLATLNAELAGRIAAGEMDLATPGLKDHLWTVTLDKLAVDQPTYAAYRASLAERGVVNE